MRACARSPPFSSPAASTSSSRRRKIFAPASPMRRSPSWKNSRAEQQDSVAKQVENLRCRDFNRWRNMVLNRKRSAMTFGKIATAAGVLLALSAASATAAPALAVNNVNLRQGPGTTYTVIMTIPGGSNVDVSGCSEWCQVTFQGQHGYAIATSFDQGGAPPPAAAGPPPAGYAGPPAGPPPAGYAP